jgi:hypothetical protein
LDIAAAIYLRLAYPALRPVFWEAYIFFKGDILDIAETIYLRLARFAQDLKKSGY